MEFRNWVDYYNFKARSSADPLEISDMRSGGDLVNQEYLTFEKERLLSLLQPDKKATLVDLGCCAGVALKLVKNKFKKCIGVDLASDALKIAKKILPDCTFIEDDVTRLGKFSDHTLSYILGYGLLHYIDPDKLRDFFSSLNRVCRKGARVVLCRIPNKKYYRQYQLYRQKRKSVGKIIPASKISWNWISIAKIKSLIGNNYELIVILPPVFIEMPFRAFFDCVLIKK